MNNGRFFITLLASSAVLLSAATPALAHSNNSKGTVVRGNVYDESNGGKGIGGLNVAVTCSDKKGTVSQNTLTNGNGLYSVTFSNSQCGKYSPVSATVTDNGQTQTDNVLVSAQRTATMDFYFGSVSVPEFGLIPGVLATVFSAGSFLALKRRKN
ncbi:MAG TPA: hypothetical protein VND99_05520 [Candidatus Acidoferrales bacterium]|nr:hypothetical protein [Candidatus Acidoferrales bacterium]